jgi:hypothetical protein
MVLISQENQLMQLPCLMQLQHSVVVDHVVVEVEEGIVLQYRKFRYQLLRRQR